MADLNEKQIRFCHEYLIDFNATKAAIRAGYSKKTAGSQAHDLLKKPEIQKLLSIEINETATKLGITREKVLQEISNLAFVDVRKFYTEDGSLKQIAELDDESAAALAGVDVYEEKDKTGSVVVGVTRKVKTYDKTKSLEMLAKHFRIFSDAPQTNNTFKIGYGSEK